MNASRLITFVTYMLQQNVIPFWQNYLSPLKWHQTYRNTNYIPRVTDPYIKAIPLY